VNLGSYIFGAGSYLLKLRNLQKGAGNSVSVTFNHQGHKLNNNEVVKHNVVKIGAGELLRLVMRLRILVPDPVSGTPAFFEV